MSDLSKLRLGTAPDSWGVWFASDPQQVTWEVYLDEIEGVTGDSWLTRGSSRTPDGRANNRRVEIVVAGGSANAVSNGK